MRIYDGSTSGGLAVGETYRIVITFRRVCAEWICQCDGVNEFTRGSNDGSCIISMIIGRPSVSLRGTALAIWFSGQGEKRIEINLGRM